MLEVKIDRKDEESTCSQCEVQYLTCRDKHRISTCDAEVNIGFLEKDSLVGVDKLK